MPAAAMPTPAPLRSRADLAGRRVIVLGLARSGVALARFCADAGALVTVYDRRPASELEEAVAALEDRAVELALGIDQATARRLLADAELVLTSPSVSPRFPTTEAWLREALVAVEAAGREVLSEVELFLRLTRARILGVTGTKGKTTTTALIGSILGAAGIRHEVGGNIGRPLVELSAELAPADWAVLELSELQLPTVSRGAEIAVYTNISADHLDRHGTVEAYRAVKARLAELSTGGVVVLNRDDEGCRTLGERIAGPTRWYALAGGDGLDAGIDGGWLVLAGERVLPVSEVRLPGRHMLANVLAAALAASLAGAPTAAIATAVRGFGGVPHRLELVASRDGVRYVNDSQATIPLAASAALEAFDAGRVVLIAGGSDKGLDYRTFADEVAARCRGVVLVGETADELAGLLGARVPVERAASMSDAVARASAMARRGDVVLLAPAAASFDMFTDYAARGDAFRAAVDQLKEDR